MQRALERDPDRTRASIRESVLERIGADLVDDETKRQSLIRRQLQRGQLPLQLDAGRCGIAQAGQDAGKIRLSIQHAELVAFIDVLVHGAHRCDAAREVFLHRGRRLLQPDQRDNLLQVVLHAMMDFLEQHLVVAEREFEFMPVTFVTHQQQDRPSAQEDERDEHGRRHQRGVANTTPERVLGRCLRHPRRDDEIEVLQRGIADQSRQPVDGRGSRGEDAFGRLRDFREQLLA